MVSSLHELDLFAREGALPAGSRGEASVLIWLAAEEERCSTIRPIPSSSPFLRRSFLLRSRSSGFGADPERDFDDSPECDDGKRNVL